MDKNKIQLLEQKKVYFYCCLRVKMNFLSLYVFFYPFENLRKQLIDFLAKSECIFLNVFKKMGIYHKFL